MRHLDEAEIRRMTMSGTDKESRLWRRDQMHLSSDIEGLPTSPHVEALEAALDALELTDEQRITALTAYFARLGRFPAR